MLCVYLQTEESWKAGASAPTTPPAKNSKKSKRFHGNIKVLVIVPLCVAILVLLTVTYWLKMKKTGNFSCKNKVLFYI